MAYSELLEDRINQVLQEKSIDFYAKRMMGGLCYMVDNKMCVGIIGDDLMARIGLEVYEQALEKPGCRPMDFTGRPMKGYVYVEAATIDNQNSLEEWIQLALDFNPKAKASKKKKKKKL